MASKSRNTSNDAGGAVRRRAGFSPAANVKVAIARAIRRGLKKRLFADRERVPCCFCGRALAFEVATLEHIRPQSRGGRADLENLTLSCQPCNSRRGNMGYEKLRGRVGQHPSGFCHQAASRSTGRHEALEYLQRGLDVSPGRAKQ